MPPTTAGTWRFRRGPLRRAPGETPEGFAERCLNLAALGIDHAVVVTAGPWEAAGLNVLCSAAGLLP